MPPKNTKQEDFELKQSNILRTDKNLSIKEKFIVNDTEVKLLLGQRIKRVGVRGANYTLQTSDYLVGITALAVTTSVGLPLPSLVGTGKHYIIKDEAGGAATTTITIRSDGERLIDGATSLTITTNYGKAQLYTNGTDWFTK